MGVKANVPYAKVVPIAQPAVGAEFLISPTGAEWWRLISLTFTLSADANVANRLVTLRANDQTTSFFVASGSLVQTAGQVVAYSAYPGAPNNAAAGVIQEIALPEGGLWLQPGHRLFSVTAALQLGDQFSGIGALVEAFPNGPYFEWVPTVSRAEYARS